MVKIVSMVEDVELNHKTFNLSNIGDTVDYTLISAIPGMEPFEDEVDWKSSNSSIAKVDGNGVVVAKDRGVALITATSVDGEVEAHCSITVKENADDREIPVGKVNLDNPVEELFVG